MIPIKGLCCALLFGASACMTHGYYWEAAACILCIAVISFPNK